MLYTFHLGAFSQLSPAASQQVPLQIHKESLRGLEKENCLHLKASLCYMMISRSTQAIE